MNDVKYLEDALVITIPTTSPEETHELLMKGITSCLRQHLAADDKRETDTDGLIVLTDLLQSLIPVRILEKQGC